MSYYFILASERELPTGGFDTAPARTYPNYEDYARSEDFITCHRTFLARYGELQTPLSKKNRQRIREIYESRRGRKGEVFIYPPETWGRRVFIRPVEGPLDVHESFAPPPEMTHLYEVGEREALWQYLCWTLRPGERVVLCRCWYNEEHSEATAGDWIVDLQAYLDGEPYAHDVRSINCRTVFYAPERADVLPFSREWYERRRAYEAAPALGFEIQNELDVLLQSEGVETLEEFLEKRRQRMRERNGR